MRPGADFSLVSIISFRFFIRFQLLNQDNQDYNYKDWINHEEFCIS